MSPFKRVPPMSDFSGSRAVTLEEVLALRDARSSRQKQLLAEYGCPLVCLSLNIAGEYKTFPLALRCFREAERFIRLSLESWNIKIRYTETQVEPAGYTAYFCAEAAPGLLKTIAAGIEKTHALGRLLDIDVLRPDGEKLSRLDSGGAPRSCFVCGKNAFVCARERSHAPGELEEAMAAIMTGWLRQDLAGRVQAAALRALMEEAAVSPKPGLVDRRNSGAHRDMDFFSFIDSSAAILPYFTECALRGFDSETPARELFDSLRPGGRLAERRMLYATGGVNVHKGIIFSFGVLCSAFGRLYRMEESPSPEAHRNLCRDMCSHLLEDFAGVNIQNARSAGERLYASGGISGIRGEVSRGFPHVFECSLPVLRRLLEKGHTLNDAGAAALLSLIANVEDTNIINRSSVDALRLIQKQTQAFLDTGPAMEQILRFAAETDTRFIKDNISPGGCADLLAVTYFVYHIFFEKGKAAPSK